MVRIQVKFRLLHPRQPLAFPRRHLRLSSQILNLFRHRLYRLVRRRHRRHQTLRHRPIQS